MRIKWLKKTLATVPIFGEMTQLLFNHEYDVEDGDSYFLRAIANEWAVIVEVPESKEKKVDIMEEKE